MALAAAVLMLGINVEIDLTALFGARFNRKQTPTAVCGIKVVGYHFVGTPGQQFDYAGETYTIPTERYVELIAEPRLKHYKFHGKKLPLDESNGALDAFSFRWVTLPAAVEGENAHE